jgi:hypothetical protein
MVLERNMRHMSVWDSPDPNNAWPSHLPRHGRITHRHLASRRLHGFRGGTGTGLLDGTAQLLAHLDTNKNAGYPCQPHNYLSISHKLLWSTYHQTVWGSPPHGRFNRRRISSTLSSFSSRSWNSCFTSGMGLTP